MITLTEKILAGLSAVPAFISAGDLKRAIGASSLAPAIKRMVKSGQVISRGRGRGTEYRLNPEFIAAQQTSPQPRSPRKKKRVKGKRRTAASRRRVTLKRIARKHIQAAAEPDRAKRLVEHNLLASGRELITAIQTQVEGLEANTTLAAAVATHQRACDLYEAL